MQNTKEKGEIGEEIACKYLVKHGYFIQERNYSGKCGEIDIIAVKDGILHFIEVKSVTNKVNYNGHSPEENVHDLKIKRLRRIIQIYLNNNKYGLDAEFKFHIITVKYDSTTGKSIIKMLENIIL